jgi:type IV pilus assembly protein PilE
MPTVARPPTDNRTLPLAGRIPPSIGRGWRPERRRNYSSHQWKKGEVMLVCSAHTRKGFTLIELMIVVAVIAILSAIAYPRYTSYIQRSHLGEAFAELGTLRQQLEQYYQDHRDYGASGSGCGGSSSPILTSTDTNPAGTQYFGYQCTSVSGDPNNAAVQTYFLTATGRAAQGMSGYTYTLDYNGNKQTTAYPGVSGTKACWLLKIGDC